MRIGILDTGAERGHKRLQNADLDGLSLYQNESGAISQQEGFADYQGHGTGITSIIAQHAPEIPLFMVKLTSFNEKITEELMVAGIAFLVDLAGIKIINVSMGITTNNPSAELKAICERAKIKGISIVAAAYYLYDQLCFPANFNSVISVASGIVQNKTQFKYLNNSLTKILAKGGFQRVAFPGNTFRFGTGTSLATAHFTGIAAAAFFRKEWQDELSLNKWMIANSESKVINLTKHDLENSVNMANNFCTPEEIVEQFRPPLNIKKIALFPYEEKEMKTIIEFSSKCIYEIGQLIGYPRTIKNVYHSEECLGNVPLTNQPLTDLEFNNFDTLVIGYFLDNLSDHNAFFGYNLIIDCIARQKNFIVWDKAVYELILRTIGECKEPFTGKVYLTEFSNAMKNKLYSSLIYEEPKTPTLCVVGTHSKQGKITTQLTVKEILESSGYKVSHLATEPQGILLGADFTFPIGHNTTVEVDIRDWATVLKKITLLIEKKSQPDVIITGSQGGILPLYPINHTVAPEKFLFVKAFYPDALICTISPGDTIDFINRTVQVITSYVNTKVLFYVLTPYIHEMQYGDNAKIRYKRLDETEYQERLAYYNYQLDRPTINIKDVKNHALILESIQNHFSKNEVYE